MIKWCLHKGSAWCDVCREFHCDPWVEVTTFNSTSREFLCHICGGFSFRPHCSEEDDW